MSGIFVYQCNVSSEILRQFTDVFEYGDELPARSEADVLIWNNNRVISEIDLERFPNLRLMVNWGTNDGNIQCHQGAAQRNIRIAKVDYYCTEAVAEFSVASMLAYERKISDPQSAKRSQAHELQGATVGIIGLGKIGFRIADILRRGYDCNIRYCSRTDKEFPEFGYCASTEELISVSDYVFVTLKGCDRGYLDIALANAGHPELLLVNISNSNLVSGSAIKSAIATGRLRGYIHDGESDAHCNLREVPGVTVSPHIAYKTQIATKLKNDILKLNLSKIYGKAAKIFLVRHGQTEWNVQGKFQGSLNSDLTEKGREQSALAGEFLQCRKLDALYTSPLGRARETSKTIGDLTGLVPEVVEQFREMHFGIFEGRSKSELKSLFSEFFSARAANSYAHLYSSYPAGESYFDIFSRVVCPALSLASNNATIAIVGHESTNRMIRGLARELDLFAMARLRQQNNEIIEIDVKTGTEISHLL